MLLLLLLLLLMLRAMLLLRAPLLAVFLNKWWAKAAVRLPAWSTE